MRRSAWDGIIRQWTADVTAAHSAFDAAESHWAPPAYAPGGSHTRWPIRLPDHHWSGPAYLVSGRSMGPGWISVDRDAIATADQLSFWIDVAMEHHAASARELG